MEKPLTTELTPEQIQRLYDVFEMAENESILDAFIDKHNRLYINVLTESYFNVTHDTIHTYEPNLEWMVPEDAQKLIYIMFGIDQRGKEYES